MSQDSGHDGSTGSAAQDSQATGPDLSAIRARMDELKEEAAAEVDRNWGSVFRSQDLFNIKVNARLSANEEYRSLIEQLRAAESGSSSG